MTGNDHDHRAPIGPDTLGAAFAAHIADPHENPPRHRCPTCARYVTALTTAYGHESHRP